MRNTLHFDVEYIDRSHETTSNLQDRNESGVKPDEEAFEFRLFSSSKAPKPTTATDKEPNRSATTTTTTTTTHQPGIHHINVRSPTPLSAAGDGAFVIPHRPQSYYFTSSTDSKRQEEYNEVAMAGTEVLNTAQRTIWPGTALPWRVIHLPGSAPEALAFSSALTITISTSGERNKGRTRAGKKKRIAARKKYKDMVLKAETEKEKRTRRNREKKVKKKAKEKLKKMEEKGETVETADEDANVQEGRGIADKTVTKELDEE